LVQEGDEGAPIHPEDCELPAPSQTPEEWPALSDAPVFDDEIGEMPLDSWDEITQAMASQGVAEHDFGEACLALLWFDDL
jgi:hypothetical protein